MNSFLSEHGLSFYIEAEQQRFVFDLGFSNVFIHNAHQAGIDLLNLDAVILSHGHYDHCGGLVELTRFQKTHAKQKHIKPKLIACPEVFYQRQTKKEHKIIPCISKKKANHHFDVILSKIPVWLTENLVFLGKIKRQFDFEYVEPTGKILQNGTYYPDQILDDSALSYKTEKGLVIITGCSHSGICNIIETAKEICHEERIIDVIGGLHLKNSSNNQLSKTVNYLSKLKLKTLYPCHCTDLVAKMALIKKIPIAEIGSGSKLAW